MRTPSFSLRRGRAGDAEPLAKLHVAVWRSTYREVATEQAMIQLDEARRLPHWHDALLQQNAGSGVWVAENEDRLLGALSAGPSTHDAFEGRVEIKHLYVREAAQGQGLGRALLAMFLEQCRAASCGPVALAVVRQNEKARAFYRRMGGTEIGQFTDPGPLWRSENIVVAWDDPATAMPASNATPEAKPELW